VLEELRRKNPVDPVTKRRKRKHFQYLTEDVGHPHVDKQITAVTTLLHGRTYNPTFPVTSRCVLLAQPLLAIVDKFPESHVWQVRS
jgi:hypothetical protein